MRLSKDLVAVVLFICSRVERGKVPYQVDIIKTCVYLFIFCLKIYFPACSHLPKFSAEKCDIPSYIIAKEEEYVSK